MYSEKQIYLLAVTDKNYVDGRFLLKDFFSLLEEIKNIILYLRQTANACSFIMQNCLSSKILSIDVKLKTNISTIY